ncbi:hydrogen gas-evolving membrane-bound hydrogenase subunit E [Halomicrococcus sp. SG-WS-1]|uniref:hydrogen gas-evolving membrane-bound hydrogenase subunit E n=1 Tax=Halomicrococcus sp. SG-WS-1 TaxID=3439057 RepID=UPI003F7A145A
MQPTSEPAAVVVLALVVLPFAAAAVTPLVYRVLGERTAYYAAAVALACFGLVASQYGTHGSVSFDWIPALGVSLRFYVDGLSLLIGFLASGVGVLILTYSRGYMHDEPGKAKYYTALLAFMGSMLGVAFAADLVALFVFWELTSLSSFILIGHYSDQASSQYAARKSMLITVSGGLFMLVGFLLLANVTGTFDLSWIVNHPEQVRESLHSAGLFVPVLGLVAIGAAAKSAQVPLHVWLPNAMEAPTPVSAFLHSATMVKAGVYLVGRFRPVFLPEGVHGIPEWSAVFTVLGLATMTIAAILAVAATDIKELLAYSTASHLGLIVAGFGFASDLGAETGAFHILNHALFKAALFLVAGIIAHEAGTRKIAELGGLWDDLPVTGAITVVAALGMAGVPPFNGFYSKEFLFDAAYHAAELQGGLAWLYPVVAVFGSVFTFLYSIRFLMLFFGDKPDRLHVHSPPKAMLVPPAILGVLAALVGLGGVTATFGVAPAALDHFVAEVMGSVSPPGTEVHFSYYLPDHVTPPVLMSAITIAVGAAAYPFYDDLHRGINRLLSVDPLRANWWYDGTVDGLNEASATAVPRIQTGLLRTYATWTLAGVVALALGGYLAASVALPAFEFAPDMTLPLALVLGVAVVGATAVALAPSHISGVLTLSILGFMVAIFYVLADAPDLALTQLVVETLTLVIFLLVLDRLPAFYGELKRSRAVRDGALSLAVGATVAVTVLVSTAAQPDLIASYFIDSHNTVDVAGGHNIVNVILVDYRAFDTMGEISVVAMAALSVLTLVAMRERGGTQ